MTRGSKPRPLSEIMPERVESLGASGRFLDATIISTWQDLSGSRVSLATEATWIEENRLFVKLSSASWRQELHLQRRTWCRKLNEQLGRDEIKEIVFR